MKSSPVIAIDFDNTIAGYDELLHALALERNLIAQSIENSKTAVRDHVRSLTGGEILWQQLQAAAYGPNIQHARLIPGVREFLQHCSKTQCQVYIVSQKTEYAAQDGNRTNLRSAAMDWMVKHCFFGTDGLGLRKENVFFEDTRRDKINRVNLLNCSHLIDDLEETFLEPGISSELEQILFSPQGSKTAIFGVKQAKDWKEISDYVFGAID